jgi:hypothetical protein
MRRREPPGSDGAAPAGNANSKYQEEIWQNCGLVRFAATKLNMYLGIFFPAGAARVAESLTTLLL